MKFDFLKNPALTVTSNTSESFVIKMKGRESNRVLPFVWRIILSTRSRKKFV